MTTVEPLTGTVQAVHKRPVHRIDKITCGVIQLIAGHGVQGDVHAGPTVKHRSRVARDPDQPNLRQVHLIHSELLDELALAGFQLMPGQMGENITTRGIDLLSLPEHTRLLVGPEAVLRITGLRNPCQQLNALQDGLMQALVIKAPDGRWMRKAGIMAVVEAGGAVHPGDTIIVHLPESPFLPLAPV